MTHRRQGVGWLLFYAAQAGHGGFKASSCKVQLLFVLLLLLFEPKTET